MIPLPWLAQQFPALAGLAFLGEGGQKVVYTASHNTDGDVVLKLIKPGQDVERVRREVLAVQQVNSARVPRVLEVGVLASPAGNFVWAREQRIMGESARQIVGRGAMSKDEVTRLGLHTLEALADAERARIVHRDVKPDNIVRKNDGSFWLLDFGIARHLDLASLTETVALAGLGTLGYAPPEQYRNNKLRIDMRADLFALGVTMIECLAGRNPYRDGARDMNEVIRRIETAPITLAPIPGDAKHRLRDFLLALTQRRVDCRPASASDALAWMRDAAAVGARP
jgi:serine/threonine protein kinase